MIIHTADDNPSFPGKTSLQEYESPIYLGSNVGKLGRTDRDIRIRMLQERS